MLIKIFLFSLIFGLVSFVALIGINRYMIASAREYIISTEQAAENGDYDCVLVLGARVHSPTRLSHMLEDRVLFGIDAYKQGAAPCLLLSGDHGQKEYDEVNAMKTYCVEQGVDPDTIFLDHAGFNTYESMYRAKEVFGAERILIVTQEYHLSRAIYIARALGLDAQGVASDPRVYGTKVYDTVREFLARIKAFGYCIIKPPPTYLGEAIPLNGSARASDDREY